MDNQRKKKVTGKAGSIKKRGEGLNTGPVGKADAYAERKEQQAQRENAQKTPQNQSMPFLQLLQDLGRDLIPLVEGESKVVGIGNKKRGTSRD